MTGEEQGKAVPEGRGAMVCARPDGDTHKGAGRTRVWRCNGSRRDNGYRGVAALDLRGSGVFSRWSGQLQVDPLLGRGLEMPGVVKRPVAMLLQ